MLSQLIWHLNTDLACYIKDKSLLFWTTFFTYPLVTATNVTNNRAECHSLITIPRATNTGINMGMRVCSPHTMMKDVMEKLLTVVVADPKAEIRLATLREFNKDFYKQLAHSDNIQVELG